MFRDAAETLRSRVSSAISLICVISRLRPIHTIYVHHELANSNAVWLALLLRARRTSRTYSGEDAMSPSSPIVASGVLLAACIALPAYSFAGSWPQQPVRILTGPLAAGSSIDTTARVLAE